MKTTMKSSILPKKCRTKQDSTYKLFEDITYYKSKVSTYCNSINALLMIVLWTIQDHVHNKKGCYETIFNCTLTIHIKHFFIIF